MVCNRAAQRPIETGLLITGVSALTSDMLVNIKLAYNTVEPRLSGLVGTRLNSPDNRESG